MIKQILIFGCLIISVLSCSDAVEESSDIMENVVDPVETNEESDSIEEPNETNKKFLIYGNAAGDFEIGDKIPEESDDYIVDQITAVRETEEGVHEELVYRILQNDEELLHLYPEYDIELDEYQDYITEIVVISDAYKTDKGIGIGSTMKDFLSAYPDFELWYTYISDMFVIETPVVRAEFILDPDAYESDMDISGDIIMLDSTDFNLSNEITGIRLIP